MAKLLLDESIPRRLKASFPESHEVITVPEMGWSGLKNGALLSQAAETGFAVLVTADKGIGYQQNTDSLPMAVVVMEGYRTRLQDLLPLMPRLLALLDEGVERRVYRIGA